MEKIINAKEAAELLDITPDHLYRLVRENKIKHSRPNGGKIYFKVKWLENYIEQGITPTNGELEAEADRFMANRGVQ